MEAREEQNQMIPFLSIASREFEKDLNALKLVLGQLEKRTHSENASLSHISSAFLLSPSYFYWIVA
jgi:hypothetical protein